MWEIFTPESLTFGIPWFSKIGNTKGCVSKKIERRNKRDVSMKEKEDMHLSGLDLKL